MKQKAFIFPGQGAQKPFMGHSFYQNFLEAREIYQKAEDILSMNITKKIFSSDEEYLKQTKFCQIALFITSIAILTVMKKQIPEILPKVTGGLSLGEYTALVAAEKVAFEDFLPLVQKRALFMQEAAMQCKQGMLAVIGLEENDIPKKYQIANLNCPGQIILAGSEKEMSTAAIELKDIGARRVIPLKVSGAFHSSYMQSAKDKLLPYIQHCNLISSDVLFVMNVSADIEVDVQKIKDNLVKQTCHKTRWLDCIRKMETLDVDYIEIGPMQLTPMNKKIRIKNSSITMEKVEDLEGLYEKV